MIIHLLSNFFFDLYALRFRCASVVSHTDHIPDERVGGFLDAIKVNSLQVVSNLNGKWNTEGGYNAALTMFKNSPNIKLVFAANDFEIIGVKSALKSLNISNVMLLGNDGNR